MHIGTCIIKQTTICSITQLTIFELVLEDKTSVNHLKYCDYDVAVKAYDVQYKCLNYPLQVPTKRTTLLILMNKREYIFLF